MRSREVSVIRLGQEVFGRRAVPEQDVEQIVRTPGYWRE